MGKEDRAMQVRCVFCYREQYAVAVYAISASEAGCSWCGRVPPVMTVAEYQEHMRQRPEGGLSVGGSEA